MVRLIQRELRNLNSRIRKNSKFYVLSSVFCLLILTGQASSAEIKNVIILVGDGMGFEQVRAASMYAYGQEGMLTFERYYRGEVATNSAKLMVRRVC
jgi:hypothetical protein